jgi:hypothetical protein
MSQATGVEQDGGEGADVLGRSAARTSLSGYFQD